LAPNRIFENDDPIFDPNFDPNCPGVLLDASSLAASLMADARVACIKFMFLYPTEVPGMWAQLFICVWIDAQQARISAVGSESFFELLTGVSLWSQTVSLKCGPPALAHVV